jgi:hypothetical protein
MTKEPVTVKGLDEPDTLKAIEGELVTVYEVGGSLDVGAVKVNDTVVEFVTVAVPTVGAPGAGFVAEALAPRIGMCLFYPTLLHLIVDLVHT